MAYAAVVSILEIVEHITQQDQYYTLFALADRQQIESLNEKFSLLQSFLDDNPPRGEYLVNHLEFLIRETAYRAQDMLEFHVSRCSSENEIESPVSNKMCSSENEFIKPRKSKSHPWRLLSAVGKVMSLRNQREKPVELEFHSRERVSLDLRKVIERVDSMVKEKPVELEFPPLEKASPGLQKVVEQVDSIVKEVIAIKESHKVVDEISSDIGSLRVAPGGKSTVVGFDEDIEEIKDKLCGEPSKLCVVSLVGMGGIGKTTLARHIFDDSLIIYHFHTRVWITISQNYNVREILLSFLRSTATLSLTEEIRQETEAVLAVRVYKSLKGVRYLIILDDMWNTEAWDDLKRILPDDHIGSRIVLTTRLSDVAIYASSLGHLHQMRFLNEDQSWSLFREKVFGDECCPADLEEIGKLVAKNCRGLPLAIVLVAGLLLSKVTRTRHHWGNIARNVSLAVTENDEHFSKILSLSYNHLPHHLKACFLYMGGFPEDYEIPVFRLINLWIAEGFLKQNRLKSLEEVAEEYLEDLVKRSLLLVTKRSSNGKFKFCSIHDLLRELCIQKARDENFFHIVDGVKECGKSKRRLCFSKNFGWYFYNNAHASNSSTRSIFCYQYFDGVTGYKLLRVLEILRVIFVSFPVEVLKLFHLRYLAFTSAFVGCTLPPSMPKLQNLQTLIISSSVTFRTSDPVLSAGLQIWKMPQLRHLVFRNITLSPISLNFGINEEVRVLENLQTLSRVRNFRFTSKAIEMIPNLKKLKVIYSGGSRNQRSAYDLDNLSNLRSLETLNIKFHPSANCWTDPVPVRFGIPPTLKKLTLSGTELQWNDMTLIGSSPILEVLKLLSLSFVGAEWEPVEGEFARLKILQMEWLDLKYWRAYKTHFPCLQRLIIRHCSLLEEIPCEIGEIPTLEVIEVDHSNLAADSADVIIEEQESMGNDFLQVRVIDW